MKIAVTGTSGFVGGALAKNLTRDGHRVVPLGRADLVSPDFGGSDAVIHCAALAHQSGVAAEEFDAANNRLTRSLADSAATAGVRRFVFVSTVNVVAGNPGRLKPSMPYSPISEYGASKARAEQALLARGDIEVVVVRPPLVYGAGAPGNLRSLMRLCALPIPLPFGSIQNKRSLVAIDNLTDALAFAATAGGIDHRIFHVADAPLSTADIVYFARQGMGKKPRLLPIPSGLLRTALSAVGRAKMAEQLMGDLVVDTVDLLNVGWTPTASQSDHLMAMGRAYADGYYAPGLSPSEMSTPDVTVRPLVD